MKFACYRDKERVSYGAIQTDAVVCLPDLARQKKTKLPAELESLVASGRKPVEEAERLLETATAKEIKYASRSISEVRLLAPVRKPGKIICLGLNYRDHAAEQKVTVPEEPVIFMKPRTAIIGPKDNIVKPSFVNQLDYEAELAVVIGKKTKNVSLAEAMTYVFGYTILNDVSARDIQFKDKQWTRGKSFDTFAPIGPWVVSAEELQDTSDLHIRTWVNDEIRQDSSTKNMVFNVEEIVHRLSRVMTLEPCDVIATGTPAGVGFAFKPQPKFLQAGDKVKIEIEGIGTLENMVVDDVHHGV